MMKYLLMAILFSITSLSQAEYNRSKDWYWSSVEGKKNKMFFAGTVNAEKSTLGQYCNPKANSCTYITSLGIGCEEGDKYPALINSDGGIASVEMICSSDNDLQISDFSLIDEIVRNATKIAFVVAVGDVQFKVVRFSLSGSAHALEMMREEATSSQSEIRSKKDEYYL